MKTKEEVEKILKYNPEIIEAFLFFAEAYHQEKLKEECHCGGYPDCICNITTHDLADLDQARDDYYNRDKLFERKQVKDK